MKPYLPAILLLVATAWSGDGLEPDRLRAAQPKLLTVSGTFDGSGRIAFTRAGVRYEHMHWGAPSGVLFDDEPWNDFDRTPAAWLDIVDRVDLTKAWVVCREGRDVLALEHTPDGFDLYVCDSPNGAGRYSITIAIPRRPLR